MVGSHLAKVNKMATAEKRIVVKRKALFERRGATKRSAASAMAGLRKRM